MRFLGGVFTEGSRLVRRKRGRESTMIESRGGECIRPLLHEDRLVPLDLAARETARRIYESVGGLPLSAHTDKSRLCGLPRTRLFSACP